MTLIPDADYCVRFVPFPHDNGTGGGMVMPNAEDDGYSIYLDAQLLSNMDKAKKVFLRNSSFNTNMVRKNE